MKSLFALLFSCAVCLGQLPVIPFVTQPGNNVANTDLSKVTNLTFWYRADMNVYHDSGITLCTDGQTVQQVNDQSKSVGAFNLHTAAPQTTCVWLAHGAGSNNLPCIEFNGGASNPNLANSMGNNTSNQPIYMAFVAAWTNTTVNGAAFCDSFNGVQRTQAVKRSAANGKSYLFANSVATWPDSVDVTNWFLYEFIWNGASSAVYTNTVAVSTTLSAGSSALQGFYLGQAFNGSQVFNGLIAEVVCTSQFVPNAAARTTIQNTLNAKYKLY